jgi:hypothetical protein
VEPVVASAPDSVEHVHTVVKTEPEWPGRADRDDPDHMKQE